MQRLPDFLLHAVRAQGADAPSAPDASDATAAADRLYKLVDDEWPDPQDLQAGLVVQDLGEDARSAYFGAADDDEDPTG